MPFKFHITCNSFLLYLLKVFVHDRMETQKRNKPGPSPQTVEAALRKET